MIASTEVGWPRRNKIEVKRRRMGHGFSSPCNGWGAEDVAGEVPW